GILLHWNGSSWTQATNPPGTEFWQSSTRTGVVALSSTDVWAVGDYDAWHFDGVSWTVPSAVQPSLPAASTPPDLPRYGRWAPCSTPSPRAARTARTQSVSNLPAPPGRPISRRGTWPTSTPSPSAPPATSSASAGPVLLRTRFAGTAPPGNRS